MRDARHGVEASCRWSSIYLICESRVSPGERQGQKCERLPEGSLQQSGDPEPALSLTKGKETLKNTEAVEEWSLDNEMQ